MEEQETTNPQDIEALDLNLSDNTFKTVEWDQFIDQLLPDTPDSSKFTKLDFVSTSFIVDSFIEKRRDESLEELREMLTEYATRIRNASLAIINEDYADFIHLSSNLQGVGRSIDKVLAPLDHVRNQIVAQRDHLSTVAGTLESKLNRLRKVRKIKSDIKKMKQLDPQLRDLQERLQKVHSSSGQDPVPKLIAVERLKSDLLEVDRTLQSISSKSKFLLCQKSLFSQLSAELERILLK